MENPIHSDFGKLRTMLIQSHMHDLKETTQDLHYENFRAKAIAQISLGGNTRERSKLKRDSSSDSPQELLQQKEAEVRLTSFGQIKYTYITLRSKSMPVFILIFEFHR